MIHRWELIRLENVKFPSLHLPHVYYLIVAWILIWESQDEINTTTICLPSTWESLKEDQYLQWTSYYLCILCKVPFEVPDFSVRRVLLIKLIGMKLTTKPIDHLCSLLTHKTSLILTNKLLINCLLTSLLSPSSSNDSHTTNELIAFLLSYIFTQDFL